MNIKEIKKRINMYAKEIRQEVHHVFPMEIMISDAISLLTHIKDLEKEKKRLARKVADLEWDKNFLDVRAKIS